MHPGRDDKVLAGWNGLMIRALAEAAGALDRPDYRDAAERAADALLVSLRRADGRLLRAVGSETPAFLEDYAALSLALLSLHGVTGSTRWLLEAVRLGEEALALFWDDEIAGFYDTGADAEQLIVRPRDLQDNAVPSGSALACEMLLRLAALTGRDEWRQKAESVLRGVHGRRVRVPAGLRPPAHGRADGPGPAAGGGRGGCGGRPGHHGAAPGGASGVRARHGPCRRRPGSAGRASPAVRCWPDAG